MVPADYFSAFFGEFSEKRTHAAQLHELKKSEEKVLRPVRGKLAPAGAALRGVASIIEASPAEAGHKLITALLVPEPTGSILKLFHVGSVAVWCLLSSLLCNLLLIYIGPEHAGTCACCAQGWRPVESRRLSTGHDSW